MLRRPHADGEQRNCQKKKRNSRSFTSHQMSSTPTLDEKRTSCWRKQSPRIEVAKIPSFTWHMMAIPSRAGVRYCKPRLNVAEPHARHADDNESSQVRFIAAQSGRQSFLAQLSGP